MTGMLLLLGLAVSAFTIGGLFDDESDPPASTERDDTETPPVDTTNDLLVDMEFEEALTQSLGVNGVSNIEFVEGPLNIDGGAGNDLVNGGAGDDLISLGSGDDSGTGGAGNDTVDLGSGSDTFGAPNEIATIDPIYRNFDLGDDSISGGAGDDRISDFFGSNTLNGGDGDDVLQSLDAASEEGVTADTLSGGEGDDTFVVDQGDIVTTGNGNDDVRIILGDGFGNIADAEVVTLQDFDQANDAIQLGGTFDTDDLRVEAFADGTGSTIFWNDTALVRVIGGQNLTLADIIIAA